MLKKLLIAACMTALCFCCLSFACAQSLESRTDPPPPRTIFERLTVKEGTPITLSLDMTTLIAQKKSRDYLFGSFTDDQGQEYKVEIRASGKYRRMKAIDPPLKIKFKKKTLKKEGLSSLNKLKIVLPWFDTPLGEEYLVREYLAYKIYEHLTPIHVRCRLVQLTLNNTKGGTKNTVALLVEDEDETAGRLGGKLVTRYGIPVDSLEMQQAALTTVYQYFIGNTDWDLDMRRNVRIVETPDGRMLTMPYDFDFSGFVNAPYATPASDSGIRNVRERSLKKIELEKDAVEAAVKTLRSHQEAIKELCKHSRVSEKAQQEMLNYTELYFRKMGNRRTPPPTMDTQE
jgi:hypothetical protein